MLDCEKDTGAKNRTYELNFYPTESGDGIYIGCRTEKQARQEYKRLSEKYPNRTGSAFIRVFIYYDTFDVEPLYDIEI